MEVHKHMWQNLLKAERKARSSKWKRIWYQPVLYPSLMIFDYAIYPYTHRSIPIRTRTFFGIRMKTVLPSGTDIRLHSTKAHDSELRFSKFLLRTVRPGDVFIDVGAHYGYYSLLTSVLTGNDGQVYAIEASSASARILRENTADFPNISVIEAAASDTKGHVTFYEYPVPYAECNTTVKDAYVGQKWLKRIQQIENHVPTVIIDDLLAEKGITKAIFKIDAEGGETAVLKGMVQSLKTLDLCVVMEYHFAPDKVSIHDEAVQILMDCGYKPHGIDYEGEIFPVHDITRYLSENEIDSDNLVFIKGL
jgi:FkbM family methyltransferase